MRDGESGVEAVSSRTAAENESHSQLRAFKAEVARIVTDMQIALVESQRNVESGTSDDRVRGWIARLTTLGHKRLLTCAGCRTEFPQSSGGWCQIGWDEARQTLASWCAQCNADGTKERVARPKANQRKRR